MEKSEPSPVNIRWDSNPGKTPFGALLPHSEKREEKSRTTKRAGNFCSIGAGVSRESLLAVHTEVGAIPTSDLIAAYRRKAARAFT